ncbi:MAG TPA: TOBE domain-containing protein [Rhizobacter sp.]|nr:TOBE domain-containing protein [Rhizobacter sp.]
MCATRRRRLVGKLAFETAAGGFVGDTRIRLLEAIVEHGSLNRAAKAVPLSYKAAWDALDTMNNLADTPLVVRTTGGANGGGTLLTAYGHEMVALYRAMESSQQDILDRLAALRKSGHVGDDATSLRSMIRRMAVRTSARNQFVGSVDSLTDTGGMIDVRLLLGGGDELVARITPESAENMALAPGVEAHALIKAPWVSIAPNAQRRSAVRNVLRGTIGEIQTGRASSRLAITTDSGRVVIAAMPQPVVAERSLRAGQTGWASFDTESVILATFA